MGVTKLAPSRSPGRSAPGQDERSAAMRSGRRGRRRSKGGSLRAHAGIVGAALHDFIEDSALRLGAALAYYAILSLAPLILVVVAIAGLVGGGEAMGREIINQMRSLAGDAGGAIASSILQSSEPSKSMVALIVGIATLLVGATGVFVQMQDSLNIIWEVKPQRGGGFWGFVRVRLLSAAIVGALGFLLVVSLVVSAGFELAQARFLGGGPTLGWVFRLLHVLGSLLVMSALFAIVFKVLPDVKVAWRDVVAGALMTGVLMTVGKFAIGVYLGHSTVGSAYGAAGSLIVVLIWTYYSSLIVFFGAELTQVYAIRRGTEILPKRGATRGER